MKLRRCVEEDYAQLRKVFKRVYPYNALLQKKNYFDWQFKKRDSQGRGKRYNLWLLIRNSHVMGYYGWSPVIINYRREAVKGCEPTLWWADKDSRSGGLALLQKIMSDYAFRLYHGCSAESERIFSLYSMPLFSLPRFIFVLEPVKVCELFGIPEKKIRLTRIESKPGCSTGRIDAVRCFDEEEEMEFDNFKSIRCHIKYTGAYLNWRYFEIPFHDYRVIRSRNQSEFCIYRIEMILPGPYAVVRILEWNFGRKSAKEAYRHLIKEGKKHNALIMDFYCSSPEISAIFLENGFSRSLEKPYNKIPNYFRPIYPGRDLVTCIDVPPYRDKAAVILDEWYITRGNGDTDRKKR